MLEPQAAATVMIARQNAPTFEVFMLRRSARSAFMPDVYVFPGGRVEAEDHSVAAHARLTGTAATADPAFVYAAARETFEESGLLFATDPVDASRLAAARRRILAGTITFTQMLADAGTSVDASALRYFSRWITPPRETRRFDTHFFAARAPAGQAAQADAGETHDGRWVAPRDALAQSAAGTFALMFPTIKHLERISGFDSVESLLDYTASKSVHTVVPEPGSDDAFAIPAALEGVW